LRLLRTLRVADMVIVCGRYCCGRHGLWPIWSTPSTSSSPRSTDSMSVDIERIFNHLTLFRPVCRLPVPPRDLSIFFLIFLFCLSSFFSIFIAERNDASQRRNSAPPVLLYFLTLDRITGKVINGELKLFWIRSNCMKCSSYLLCYSLLKLIKFLSLCYRFLCFR